MENLDNENRENEVTENSVAVSEQNETNEANEVVEFTELTTESKEAATPEEPKKERQRVVLGSKKHESNEKKKMPTWVKGLIIFVVIVLCIMGLFTKCGNIIDDVKVNLNSSPSNEVVADFGHDYIGTLFVEGQISEYDTGTYNHQYLLNAIDAMMEDDYNKGIILHVNTPGGSVFASDELYLKIKEYQEKTKRPVYSSMQNQATSGGYYISASADKIIANRNCWTGSIGVTLGSFMDVSELLDRLGIKTTTITSGPNKAMGSNVEPMSPEQREIFQSLVDEAFDQFVGIVAEGRDMSEAKVRKIADGRIYTAKQALKIGLIDSIGTYEEAIADMKKEYKLKACEVENFVPESSSDLYSLLGISAAEKRSSGITDAEAIKQLIDLDGTFKLEYISDVRK